MFKSPLQFSKELAAALPALTDVVRRPGRYLLHPLARTPFPLQAALIRKLLQDGFGEAIREGEFDSLIHRWVKVTVVDLELSWSLSLAEDRSIRVALTETADTEIRGDSAAFALIAGRRMDPDTLFFQRRIVILGDTELGHEMKNLLDTGDLNDLPAPVHKMLELASSLAAYWEASKRDLAAALSYKIPVTPQTS
ncbi:SCP2 sterol-binding domain-containing protein [Hahella sp. CR1]|uniref:ubiquinone anaerobic biosynthesis accessory factor UbiT n=1 Tax=Hahella sp. CR1 TaxID=2992807 RepID=UPI0024433E99|nr:SCP2 sterol-binding domain-containing protein [Hahella sp. CR1]MDG9671893.1 SCP2 sterol-binding domain-containing protein [Hahella sp. CR1]